MSQNKEYIAVVGLGYVGLPLAMHCSAHYPTIGYDKDSNRIKALRARTDNNHEFNEDLANINVLELSEQLESIRMCTAYIIAVPTPLKDSKPDLSILKNACADIGSLLKPNDLVVIESTVHPGTTENICIPILERVSGLNAKKDFCCGYSPERVRPASKQKDPTSIVKLTSGYTAQAVERINAIYSKIIKAGTFKVSSIQIAEMSKIVENIQRDVNIALSNEIAMMCHTLGINTHEVLEAADSKWDFQRFNPGLVGGHCIGVDSVYLIHHMRSLGFSPQLVELARKTNDQMVGYIADNMYRLISKSTITPTKARVLIMGFSFKEDCNDCRNTMVAKLVRELDKNVADLCICDPHCDAVTVKKEYGLEIKNDHHSVLKKDWDVIIFAVAHTLFKKITVDQLAEAIVMDIKGIAPRADWRL